MGYPFTDMEEFNRCIETLDVEDCPTTGVFLTWSNLHMDGTIIYNKLDRVMINERWNNTFQKMKTIFEAAGVSDHSPAIIKIKEVVNTGPKPFKFYQFYMKHLQYDTKLNEVWDRSKDGNPTYKMH